MARAIKKKGKKKTVRIAIYFKLYFEFSCLPPYLEFTNKMFGKCILLKLFNSVPEYS